MTPIYLDYNATTPIDPDVASAMRPFVSGRFGNPSSGHAYGVETARAVARAREQAALALGCELDEIVFTSGGSESNNHAIKGVADACRDHGDHIVTSAVEHPAVANVCAFLAARGYRVTTVPVNGDGRVDPAAIEDALTSRTILVSVMHANNEVGTVQPIADIAARARAAGVLVHCDAAQSVGKLPVDVDALGIDLLSVAGHKVYAPKGVGALFVRRGTPITPLIHGADHESGRRAGTENVMQIVGLGRACQLIHDHLGEHVAHMRQRRDQLEAGLERLDADVRIHARDAERLPNTTSVGFRGVAAAALLERMPNVAASAGAACHSDAAHPSSVLDAMDVPTAYAMGTVRFSIGRATSEEEIEVALASVEAALSATERPP